MTSNAFSGADTPGRSRQPFFDELRNNSGGSDAHHDASGLGVDEQNLQADLRDYDLESGMDGGQSRMTLDSRPDTAAGAHITSLHGGTRGRNRNRWQSQDDDDEENDVPESLLMEPNEVDGVPDLRPGLAHQSRHTEQPLLGGHPSHKPLGRWDASRSIRKSHKGNRPPPAPAKLPTQPVNPGAAARSARDKASWRWVNVSNLDQFMLDVYNYYEGCGIWCILTDRGLHLLETTFVAVFLTFLTQCIDHSKISGSKSLDDLVIPQCTRQMSIWWSIGLWMFTFYFIWKVVQFAVDLRRLSHLRDFFVHLLGIPEQDMQTVSWQDIVARIMALRDSHAETANNLAPDTRRFLGSQSKKRLDAHDIANRLMRQENYVIALINKDVLNFTLPIPFLGNRSFFSRTLEWYLNFVIIDFVFDRRGQVNQEFLKARRRGALSAELRRRFAFAGVLNLFLAPFALAYRLVLYFFNSFLEFKSDPSKIGARRYTPLAEWKFREFNELPHLFSERTNMSYPFATRYLDQFPKQVTERIARTVAFISGALAAVLTLASLIDPEIFSVELTPERTGLFYIGVLGAVWAFARGRVSEDELVFDPEYAMRNVIEYTHYMPDHWRGRLHSSDVMQEFSELYKLKWVIFLEEVLGIIATPFLLLFPLSNCSDQIVDFFREFTVHVDGLGYVCSFAVFDFNRGGDQPNTSAKNDVREDYYSTKHGKMAASYYGFLDNYVINPKTGIPGHMPPGMRPAFHAPPTFPPLGSPMLAADMRVSRIGRGERDRPRSRAAGPHVQGGWAPRAGASAVLPSPMASVLLDPHHQPAIPTQRGQSIHRGRQPRGNHGVDAGIAEEPVARGSGHPAGRNGDDEDFFEGGGDLGESVWETSPTKALSRENSSALAEEPEVGVLGLIYQFQQAHQSQRTKGTM
ncbi:related to APG9 - integral membrane protein required for Cvt and autophagy transport [Cephalotrichum gorgonifer]|uniref:Autophagy-related protein 9 n=1 Tax=Cephalotrichum gorgonifer TaxID=2041049 RepID=A0AAE8MV64_9PEZI|nr:related to APG9 - integral membrane protein required for Cvt and autophagy transport [Cephalotrichum gorgonifer]